MLFYTECLCYNILVNMRLKGVKPSMKKTLSILAALLLVSSLVVSLASCGSSGTEEEEVESTTEYDYTESVTPVKKSSEEVLQYFNQILNSVKTEKPGINYTIEKNVPNDSIRVTKKGEEDKEETDSSLTAINDSAKGVKDLILEKIKKSSGQVAFGDENSDVLFVKGEAWASSLTDDDIDYATMKEVGDNYLITIAFNDLTEEESQKVLTKAFDLRDKEDILNSEEFKKTEAYLKLNGYDVSYSGCYITATVNRLTDELTEVNYFKAANVTADMTGLDTFEKYGDVSVMFTLEDKARFEINWDDGNPVSPLDTTIM